MLLRRLLLLALALAEATVGCGGSPVRAPGPAFKAEEDLTRSAGKAWAGGDLRAAIVAQQRALVAARSVEDDEGIALRILDLAALYRAGGEAGEAHATLTELLAEAPSLAYPGRWRAEAARLAGLLALDGGDTAAATRWAARAFDICRAARCPDEGAIVNLQARAAFLAGDREGAIRLARTALPLNKSAKDEEETANSSRIIADAELGAGRHANAGRAFAAALALDKELGLEAKIVLDLIGLGNAARGEGRTREARDYFERARTVARSSGDAATAAQIDALLEQVAP